MEQETNTLNLYVQKACPELQYAKLEGACELLACDMSWIKSGPLHIP